MDSRIRAEYPVMFVIRTPAMDEAEREEKGFFKTAVSVVPQDDCAMEDATHGSRLSRKVDEICRGPQGVLFTGGVSLFV
jgi:hypothetical protein